MDPWEDLDLVVNVLTDALERGLTEDEGVLKELVDTRKVKTGPPAQADLYDALNRRRKE